MGGIELAGLDRRDWVGPVPKRLDWDREKGARLGNFRFGSTVVLLFGPDWPAPAISTPGREVRLGETILGP